MAIRKKTLYLCFLDLKKAFDTVKRNILFQKLCAAGIRGKLLRVIQNLFSSNPANVLVDGFLSPEFIINRGVLQGSKLGPILFNLFINDLLEVLNKSNLGATVGLLHFAALGFADDIVLISDTPRKLQRLLDICSSWTRRNQMTFKTSKCKVMILNGTPKNVRFTLDNVPLKIVSTYKYLGVVITSKYVTNLFKDHFDYILKRAKTRVATIRGLGFSKNGFRVKSSVRLYKLLVRPILEFCAQTLMYALYSHSLSARDSCYYAKKLEHFQTQVLKNLINCPRSTSPAIVRLFTGTEPLACRLEIMKLRYFWKTLHGPKDALTYKILTYRKERLLDFSKGFAQHVFNICIKYNAINLWHGLIPSKFNRLLNPLQCIKRIIISKNLRSDLENGRASNSSFATIYLANKFLYQKNYHIVEPFIQANCFSSPQGRYRFIKALLHPCSYIEECLLCQQKYKDICEHLLTACTRTVEARTSLELKLTLYNYPRKAHLRKTDILEHALSNKIWRKCFTDFLMDIEF